MAHFSVVKDLWKAEPAFAIVSEGPEAHYVFAPDKAMPGLTDSRVKRMIKMTGGKIPGNHIEWVRLLTTNVGYFASEAPVEASNLDEATNQAIAKLSVNGPVTPVQ